jgi:hypothetical protein
MKDWLHSALKVVDYERGKIVGFLIAIAIIAGMAGCPLQTKSPISGNEVTPAEWVVEVQKTEVALGIEKADIERNLAAYNAKVKLLADQDEAIAAEYAKQAEIQQKFFELAGGVATTLVTGGAVAWPEILTSLLAIGGVGVAAGGMYDSKRKNAVIAAEKAKTTTG